MRISRLEFYKHDIVTYFANIFKRYKHIVLFTQKMKPIVARHNKSQNLCTAPTEYDIANPAKHFAVYDIDYLFTAEFAKR